MQPSRPIAGAQPRRSTLLIGILLCVLVALALVVLVVEPMLA